MWYEKRAEELRLPRDEVRLSRGSINIGGQCLPTIPDIRVSVADKLVSILKSHGYPRAAQAGFFSIDHDLSTREVVLYVEFLEERLEWVECLPKPLESRKWHVRSARQRFLETTHRLQP